MGQSKQNHGKFILLLVIGILTYLIVATLFQDSENKEITENQISQSPKEYVSEEVLETPELPTDPKEYVVVNKNRITKDDLKVGNIFTLYERRYDKNDPFEKVGSSKVVITNMKHGYIQYCLKSHIGREEKFIAYFSRTEKRFLEQTIHRR